MSSSVTSRLLIVVRWQCNSKSYQHPNDWREYSKRERHARRTAILGNSCSCNQYGTVGVRLRFVSVLRLWIGSSRSDNFPHWYSVISWRRDIFHRPFKCPTQLQFASVGDDVEVSLHPTHFCAVVDPIGFRDWRWEDLRRAQL